VSAIPELRRHELVRLTAAAWREAMTQHVDRDAQRCIAHWAANDLPLAVATQIEADGLVSLGLPAPRCWQRRRLALRIPGEGLRRGGAAWPRLSECAGSPRQQGDLCGDRADKARSQGASPSARVAAVASLLPDARVIGSFAWQHLTGLRYVRESSDLDLLLEATGAAQADMFAMVLAGADASAPRLDGEICFADGSAVSWREWAGWRAGRARAILVKRLHGASLATEAWWHDESAVAAPA
jgi:phosphoribosyl-dephospho-CoA transferase